MNRIILKISLLLMSFTVFAQAELKNDQFEGYVITKDGTKLEGFIEVSNINHPWTFQESIKFFDKTALEDGKVKRKEKAKYKPEDLLEYGIGNRKFKSIEYNDFNQQSNNGLNETIGLIRATSNVKHFAEVYYEGKISVYKFYSSPTGFSASIGQAQIDEMEEFVRKCKTTFNILIEKEGEKCKAFDQISIKKFFKSCDLVVKKFENNEYTKKPVKGLKSLIKSEMLKGEPLASAAMEIVMDFEKNCEK